MSAQVVGLAGAGLIVTNLWIGPQRTQLAPLWAGSGDLTGAHSVVKQLGAEVVGVGVLTVWASSSSSASRTALAIIGCLWVLWLIRRGKAPFTTTASAAASAAANPFRTPGTVSPPVNTGPAVGSGKTPTGAGGVPYSRQIPGLPPIPGYPYPTN